MEVQDATSVGAYETLLNVSQYINRIALVAHLPATLVAEVFIQDPHRKKEILNLLRAVEAMSAAPVLQDKKRRGYHHIRQAPDKMQAAIHSGQSVGGEYLLQSVPVIENILANLLLQR